MSMSVSDECGCGQCADPAPVSTPATKAQESPDIAEMLRQIVAKLDSLEEALEEVEDKLHDLASSRYD